MSNSEKSFEETIQEESLPDDPERYCMACNEPLRSLGILVCLDCLNDNCDSFEKAAIKKVAK